MPKLRLIPRSRKTLHLLRHAKSSWKELGLDDHERPLSKRGHAAASAMAKHMGRAAIAPDIVLCSTAVRAKETLEPIAKKLKPAKVTFESGIYEVAERELWKYVCALPEQAGTVLMIGHNPDLHNFALALADADSVDRLPPPHGKFPSGALATFSFDGQWKDLRPRGAHLASFVRPRELTTAKRKQESSPAKRRRG
jgi:phosphohistidine phosphatase